MDELIAELLSSRDMPRTEEGYLSCLRSGYCCKTITCAAGRVYGADAVGCKFLLGDGPGEYECQIAKEHPELHESMAIGGGCSSTLFNPARTEAWEKRSGSETSKSSAQP